MKHLILPLLALFLLCSCGKQTILDSTHTFNQSKWLRFEPESFSAEAPNTDDCFNFIVSIQFDTTVYREAGLPLMMEITSPAGDTRTLFSTIVLRNHENHWMGEFDNNGMLNVTSVIKQFYFFNVVGTHTIKLSQRTSKYEIGGINNINLKIEKTKIEYPE